LLDHDDRQVLAQAATIAVTAVAGSLLLALVAGVAWRLFTVVGGV